MSLSIIILLIVLTGIMTRKWLPFHFPIWSLMLLGGVSVVATKQISLPHAVAAINFEVIFYLFGVFVIVQALECCGYLEQITDRLFGRSKTGADVLLVLIIALGLSSAVLMNDTTAIAGTPIILQLCRRHKHLAKLLLMALAYSITIGSTLSPIGNPQNLLIAVKSGMSAPFTQFFYVLAIPTFINLGLLYLTFRIFFRDKMKETVTQLEVGEVNNPRTAWLGKIAIFILLAFIITKIILGLLGSDINIDFSVIALIAAAPILLLSHQRKSILFHLDWGTLLFFFGMFVLMQSVWDSEFFQTVITKTNMNVGSVPTILAVSTIVSQFISNVPLVALYLPLLKHLAVHSYHYLALAAGSTLAGNLFVFGAASNIIILQNAEKRGHFGFSVGLFSLIGIPLTVINLAVYAVFIEWIK